jgi:UDP-N-acetylglucosamine:LPS N-acetylglucosamine transferase
MDDESSSAADMLLMMKEETSSVTSTASRKKGLKVLFLSSDTGGGHRASAESLAKQFQILFPGTTYDIMDVVENVSVPPYNGLVKAYKHLSSHPSQWKLVYSVSNSRAFEMLADAHLKLTCERAVRKVIMKSGPDVVVSVHPMMTNVPVLSCSKISNETGRHLPMFTVVTDLGSAHCLWFANGVEKMFIGSEQVRELAKSRGKVPDDKLVMSGLPIRHDFAVQAENMGDRMSPQGKLYQLQVRQNLGLTYTNRKTILVMGGGEGVGSLANIVDALYVEFLSQGIDASILVVCGRNEKLKNDLETRDWEAVFKRWSAAKERFTTSTGIMAMSSDMCGPSLATPGCIERGTVTGSIRRMLSKSSLTLSNAVSTPFPTTEEEGEEQQYVVHDEKKASELELDIAIMAQSSMAKKVVAKESPTEHTQSLVGRKRGSGKVEVVGLGFITEMAKYMVASDVLVSKAGPGTISEATAVSLPILLTSYLPGQEEGNVDFVIDGGFGAYCDDSDPLAIAEELCMWLNDDKKLNTLSKAAHAKGAPHAARDIARVIGESTLKWIDLNDEKANPEARKVKK